MKANKKTLILLGIAVAFTLGTSGAYAFLFYVMKNKTEATATFSEKIDELSGKEARIASSVAILRKENTNIEKISEYFFKESEVVAFTKKIEALGAQSGTTLSIESLDQGYTEKTVPFLNFRIKATGKFSNIQRLLILLENFPGKFEWKTVRLVRETLPTPEGSATSTKMRASSEAPIWRVEAFLVALNFTNQ